MSSSDVVDKNMKLECMRRRQHVLVASFAIDFWHVSPLSLVSASFLLRRSTFRGISLGFRVPHWNYYGQHVLFGIAGRLIMAASFAVGFCHISPLSLASTSFLFHSRHSRCFANFKQFLRFTCYIKRGKPFKSLLPNMSHITENLRWIKLRPSGNLLHHPYPSLSTFELQYIPPLSCF